MDERVGAYFSATRVWFTFTSLPSWIVLESYEFLPIHDHPIPLHQLYYPSISVFLNLVILKFQGMDTTTPFHTHPNTANAAVISFLLFVLCVKLQAAGARLAFLPHFAFLFWSLCVASLVSLVQPDAVRPFLYVFSTAPFVAALLHCVCPILWRKFQDFQWIVLLRFNHLLRQLYRNQMQNPRLPV